MKTVDFSKDISYEIYRGANAGIETMSAGSFYTFEKELAVDYAEMNDDPCLYTFSIKGLKFLVVDNNEDIDYGAEYFTKEEIENYDGVRTKSYSQDIMFGEFCCKTGVFSKSSYEDVIKGATCEHRNYNR